VSGNLFPYLVVLNDRAKVHNTVISRWFGKFKKLTTGKRNLHFIEIKGFGKHVQVLKHPKFVLIQDVF